MNSIFNVIAQSTAVLFLWLGALCILFTVLGRWMPCNPQAPWWRKDSPTDLIYFFVMPILNRFMRIIFIGAGIAIIYHGMTDEEIAHYFENGFGPLGALPVWLQAAIIFILSDIILYWTHRTFHQSTLWHYHSIHHSSEHVDWLSTYRFHPINSWLSFTLVDALTLLVGFSPEAVSCMATFNMLYSAMVHANLNWTFGPFKYLLASPVFHRWHHTSQAEGMDKNFAPTFPLLDILFGTFYMPEGRLPEHYGVPGSAIPHDFIGQMIWPFKARKN